MRVIIDRHAEVVRHFRTIEIEDGPLIDAGASPMASYYPGTIIRATKIKQEWIGDTEPVTVLVSGPYQGYADNKRSEYSVRYRMDALPGWLKEIL